MWSHAKDNGVDLRVPYVVDVTKTTFEHLDALLRRVIEDLDGTRDWPPPAQEKECIAVAALNLLRLQVEFYLCSHRIALLLLVTNSIAFVNSTSRLMHNLHYRLTFDRDNKNEIPGTNHLKLVKFQNLVEKCFNV